MNNGWETVAIGDICAAIYDGPHATPKKTTEGPIFLGISNLQNGQINLSDAEHLSEEDFIKWTRRVTPRENDIVFSYETRLGEAALAPKALRFCLGRRMALMRPDINKVVPRFLLYAYLGPEFQQTLRARTVHGSTVDRIPLIEFPTFPISIPPISEQRAIAGILGALDDKIESNRRMNRTLESMAWAVFRHWFLEGEENKWEEKSLDEIADFLNGLALQKFPPEDDDYLPVIKIAQLRKNDTKDADKASTTIPPEYVIKDGDILFSWSGSLEVIVWCGGKGALNQHLFKVTSEKYPKWFYYYWTKYHLPEFQEIAAGKATTMGHIQRHHLRDAKVLVPIKEELQEMDKIMSPLLDKIINHEKESRTLASLRDTLLPKLMRGEVRVKNVEKEI
jgi:type I restriction enzyme, S subunit